MAQEVFRVEPHVLPLGDFLKARVGGKLALQDQGRDGPEYRQRPLQR